jgi:hypothetical protein
VFFGTKLHKRLVELNLAELGNPLAGYIPYRIQDPTVAKYDENLTELKSSRQDLANLNSVLYDLSNIRARLTNSNNVIKESTFNSLVDDYGIRLQNLKADIQRTYVDGFTKVLNTGSALYFPEPSKISYFRDEADRLLQKIRSDYEGIAQLSSPILGKIELKTWQSNVNYFGINGPRQVLDVNKKV